MMIRTFRLLTLILCVVLCCILQGRTHHGLNSMTQFLVFSREEGGGSYYTLKDEEDDDSVDVVICHCKGDLLWLKKLEQTKQGGKSTDGRHNCQAPLRHIHVYSKCGETVDTDLLPPCTRVYTDLPNNGTEPEAYYTHIIRNYDFGLANTNIFFQDEESELAAYLAPAPASMISYAYGRGYTVLTGVVKNAWPMDELFLQPNTTRAQPWLNEHFPEYLSFLRDQLENRDSKVRKRTFSFQIGWRGGFSVSRRRITMHPLELYVKGLDIHRTGGNRTKAPRNKERWDGEEFLWGFMFGCHHQNADILIASTHDKRQGDGHMICMDKRADPAPVMLEKL